MAEADPKKHLLNLYLPQSEPTFPLAMFVHGGSWRRGDKDDRAAAYAMLGRNLARDGIGVAVINYRLSPQVRHPEHAQDVARAVAWARRPGLTTTDGGQPKSSCWAIPQAPTSARWWPSTHPTWPEKELRPQSLLEWSPSAACMT